MKEKISLEFSPQKEETVTKLNKKFVARFQAEIPQSLMKEIEELMDSLHITSNRELLTKAVLSLKFLNRYKNERGSIELLYEGQIKEVVLLG